MKPHSGQRYFTAFSLQEVHLTIGYLLHAGHMNLAVPFMFVALFLQDKQCSSFMELRQKAQYKKVFLASADLDAEVCFHCGIIRGEHYA